MQLIVNGEPRVLAGPMTVADLVAVLGLDRRKVAVERNLEIVPRSLHGETRLADGDRIEIVSFVGGADGRRSGRPFGAAALASPAKRR